MNNNNSVITFLQILCMSVIMVSAFRSCLTKDPDTHSHSHNYSTLYSDTNITIQNISNTYVKNSAQLQPVDSVRVVRVEKAVDSAAIFRIWATKYFYQDKYKDSLIDVTIADTVYRNRIVGRSFHYTATIPQMKITNTVQKKWQVSIGGVGSVSNFGGSAIIKYKRNSFQTAFILLKQYKCSTFGIQNQWQFGYFRQL